MQLQTRGPALLAVLWALPCQGLFFELKGKSIAGKECFTATPGHGHLLHGSYEADGASEGILVTLKGVSDRELYRSSEPSGKFSIEVMDEGNHHLCFESSVDVSQMISFNFHVDEHGDGTDAHDKSHMEYVTKEHTIKMEELVQKLEAKAQDILDQQQYAITREAVHRETAESTNARVMWWTLAEVAVLISLSAFQAYYLRSYFEVKQII
eukprot:TRINITY_DN107942_c0_g1_i1.p1 TRINITY_DN107942_c0_g1~~TRINITY_DN107942_c0_g1_i1.p1  ORF type:complete len:226 (-),score=45.28 TRINITY_DN107942_c0_g1_i1:10-639(-)